MDTWRAHLLLRIVGSASLVGITLAAAHAQQPGPPLPPPPANSLGIEILATPYLWFSWSTTTIHPSDPALLSTSSTVGPGALITHITWFPFMGAAEIRSGAYGFLADYIHAPIKAGINTNGVAFGSADVGLSEDIGTGIFMYRAYSDPDQYVDLGVGVRAWGLGGTISLNQGALPPVSVLNGTSWADGLAAARYQRKLGDGLGATFYVDVGAGGANLDWQAIASLDYALTPRTDLHLAFRSLNVDANGKLAGFNVHTYGPLLSATFHFSP